jgi:hypothetical protein
MPPIFRSVPMPPLKIYQNNYMDEVAIIAHQSRPLLRLGMDFLIEICDLGIV